MTTTIASFWAVTDEEAAKAWAESAVEYVESLGGTYEDREAAITSRAEMAIRVCRQLSIYEEALLRGTGDDLDTETDRGPDDFTGFFDDLGRSPAQVEADMRERLGIERWELFGAVWVESLVEGLCVR